MTDHILFNRITEDILFIKNIFDKLIPSLPEPIICKIISIGKNIASKPRLLNVSLSSSDDVNRVVVPFLHLRSNSPNDFSHIHITRDCILLKGLPLKISTKSCVTSKERVKLIYPSVIFMDYRKLYLSGSTNQNCTFFTKAHRASINK